MRFFNRKKKESESVDYIRTGFWSNPIFDNPNVHRLYKQYLSHAGHCPICNDFLFIDIEHVGGYYNVQKRCINHKCDYKLDISDGFNQRLGLFKPKISTKPSNEICLNDETPSPLTTGTLKMSYQLYNPQLKTVVTKRLPSPSEATTDEVYIVPIDNGGYKIYITTIFCDEYSWILLDEIWGNLDEFEIEKRFDVEKREEVYKVNPKGKVKVSK